MIRPLFLLCTVALACGPAPTPSSNSVNLGTPPPSTTPPTATSPNALGPCTGADLSSCANGKGVCFGSPGAPQKQCIALADANGTCPGGAFAAKDGNLIVCLDNCASVRDCAAGFACTKTLLHDVRDQPQDVAVCLPGV